MNTKVAKEKQQSGANKAFKLDKTTKRLMALGTFPVTLKLSPAENKEHKIETASRIGFKNIMIEAKKSLVETSYSPLRDPLWKSVEKKESDADSNEKKGKKGKKHRKMRKNAEVETQAE